MFFLFWWSFGGSQGEEKKLSDAPFILCVGGKGRTEATAINCLSVSQMTFFQLVKKPLQRWQRRRCGEDSTPQGPEPSRKESL